MGQVSKHSIKISPDMYERLRISRKGGETFDDVMGRIFADLDDLHLKYHQFRVSPEYKAWKAAHDKQG